MNMNFTSRLILSVCLLAMAGCNGTGNAGLTNPPTLTDSGSGGEGNYGGAEVAARG